MTQYPDESSGTQYGRVPSPGTSGSGREGGGVQPSYPARSTERGNEAEYSQSEASSIASPDALGLGMLAFTTIVLGCYYANFILPGGLLLPYNLFVRMSVGPILLGGGIVELLAGMWAFRRNSVNTANVFSAYGGFLLMIGYLFLPTGILTPLTIVGVARLILGLVFLCWTIFTVVLMAGSFRTNSALRATLILLALAYLFLAIGGFANSVALLRIGGWLAIICALVAWVGTALELLGRGSIQEAFNFSSRRSQQPATAL
jgi:succinate-acetate transporter protein